MWKLLSCSWKICTVCRHTLNCCYWSRYTWNVVKQKHWTMSSCCSYGLFVTAIFKPNGIRVFIILRPQRRPPPNHRESACKYFYSCHKQKRMNIMDEFNHLTYFGWSNYNDNYHELQDQRAYVFLYNRNLFEKTFSKKYIIIIASIVLRRKRIDHLFVC